MHQLHTLNHTGIKNRNTMNNLSNLELLHILYGYRHATGTLIHISNLRMDLENTADEGKGVSTSNVTASRRAS